jgi:L-threonylcarbamoyladenylate synthase
MNFDLDIENCLSVLNDGGVILYPTDTVWGLGCDATIADAVQRVYDIKNRPDEKALIVLVADKSDILKHVASPDLALFDHLQKTSKPTTVIYAGAIGFADNLIAKDGSIAIRICEEKFCKHLIKRFRKPIVSTSANISGKLAPANFSLIDPQIISSVDYVVKYRQDDLSKAEPSSLIRWKNGKIEVLRP